MKQFKNLLFLSLILLCWTLVSCKSSKTSSGWSLIWEENFNQKKSFDSQVWSKIPRGKSDWNNYMTDFDSCFDMRDGNMVLRGSVTGSKVSQVGDCTDAIAAIAKKFGQFLPQDGFIFKQNKVQHGARIPDRFRGVKV